MKNKLTIIICIVMASFLIGCGNNNETENLSVETETTHEKTTSEVASTELAAENNNESSITDVVIVDKEHINEYSSMFRESESYDPVFEERCMVLNGVKTYLPTTVSEFEKLFDVEFTSVEYTIYGEKYKTDDNRTLIVQFSEGDIIDLDNNALLLEGKEIKITGFCYSQEIHNNEYGHEKAIWVDYDAKFEETDGYVNQYGYYKGNMSDEMRVTYSYYPACYQAYYEYINGTLPVECIESNEFDTFYNMQSIIDYSGYNNIRIGFGDATCDALDEMFIKTMSETYVHGYNDVHVFTYDVIDKKMRRIYYSWLDVEPSLKRYDDVSVCNGLLKLEEWTDDQNSRNNVYIALNRYGREWLYNECNYFCDTYYREPEYRVNGDWVDKDIYDIADFKRKQNDDVIYYPMDDAIDELGRKGNLKAEAIQLNGLSYKTLKDAINDLHLDQIGFNNDEHPDNEIDADNAANNSDVITCDDMITGYDVPEIVEYTITYE